MPNKIAAVFKKLFKEFGRQKWWPISWKNKKDEIIIGAILTQNTIWSNVEKALKNLSGANINSLPKIRSTSKIKLAQLIKPTGYYNQKAKKLKIIADFFHKHPNFANYPLKKQRSMLLNLWGIGEETADSILNYAFNQPVFVVDAYTKRIFYRLKIINSEKTTTKNIQQSTAHSNVSRNVKMKKEEFFQEFHALLVKLAKTYCLKTKPLCPKCPLQKNCPHPKN